jgi:hypothetical protein
MEVVLPDKTRCDCVTDTHAIEFDFGNNWPRRWGKVHIIQFRPKRKRGLFSFWKI